MGGKSMKSRVNIFNLVLVFCMLFCNGIWATSSHQHKGKKVYIAQEQIFAVDDRIFVTIGDDFFEASCIHKSAAGLFTYTGNLSKIDDKFDWDMKPMIRCPRCKRCFATKGEYEKHICEKK